MRSKITIHFSSIDLNDSRTFYNIVREKAKELSNDKHIFDYDLHLQTQLDCNIFIKKENKVIICSICNERFKRIYTPTKPNALLYQHDCKLYENIFQQKKIINIEVI